MYLVTLIDTAPHPVIRVLTIIGAIALAALALFAGMRWPPEIKP